MPSAACPAPVVTYRQPGLAVAAAASRRRRFPPAEARAVAPPQSSPTFDNPPAISVRRFHSTGAGSSDQRHTWHLRTAVCWDGRTSRTSIASLPSLELRWRTLQPSGEVLTTVLRYSNSSHAVSSSEGMWLRGRPTGAVRLSEVPSGSIFEPRRHYRVNRRIRDSRIVTTDEFMIDLREQLVLAARRLHASRQEREARIRAWPRCGARPTEGRNARP